MVVIVRWIRVGDADLSAVVADRHLGFVANRLVALNEQISRSVRNEVIPSYQAQSGISS